MIESIEKILLNCFSDQIEVILDSVNRRDLLTEKMCWAIKLLCTVVSWCAEKVNLLRISFSHTFHLELLFTDLRITHQ
jgi:hypothetical protein